MPDDDLPICRRCSRPVRREREMYEAFERMHYVCFHYAFEHGPPRLDLDEDCGVAGCPSAAGARSEELLARAARELAADWENGQPADWDNVSIPDYLTALADWVEEGSGHYVDRGEPVPWNGWLVLAAGLRAATKRE
jgi:hypothetical protein